MAGRLADDVRTYFMGFEGSFEVPVLVNNQ